MPLPNAEQIFAKLITRWTAATQAVAWWVIGASVLSAVLLGFYAATNFSINTDTTDMIDPDLSFRQAFKTYKEAFQKFNDPIVVVIDGETPDLADRAADRVAERLRADPDHFSAINHVGGETFFRVNGLLYLDVDELYDLADRLAAAQPMLAELNQDMSLRGLFGILAEGAEEIADGDSEPQPELALVFDKLALAADKISAGERYFFSWQDIMSGEDSSIEDRRRFVIVQPVQDYRSIRPSAAAIKEVRRIIVDLGFNAENGVRVRLTGSAPLADEELKGISEDAGLAGAISFVLVALILFVGLRSPQVATASLITILIGLIWTAAFAVAAVGAFNLISVAFAVLFIGLSVDLNIHYGLRFREAVSDGMAPVAALSKTASDVGWALTLAVVSDAIAFFSFVPTSYIGIAELGIISGTGMFIALFATMTLLPALLSVLPIRQKRSRAAGGGRSASIDRFIRHHMILISGVAAIIGLTSLFGAQNARFDFDPINLRDPGTESVRTFHDLQKDPDTSAYIIKALEPDLPAADALATRIEALPAVKDVVTLSDLVPEEQDEKLDVIDGLRITMIPILYPQDDQEKATPGSKEVQTALTDLIAALHRLSKTPGAEELHGPAENLARALESLAEATGQQVNVYERTVLDTLPDELDRLRMSMGADSSLSIDDLPDSVRWEFMADDGRARLEIRPAEDVSNPAILENFVDQVRSVAPHATGGPVLIVESGRAIIDAFIVATGIATVIIFLFLMLLLRSAVDTLLVLIPLALAALMTLATAALFDLPFNFANVIVLPLLIGLGVDSGVHMVLRERTIETGRTLMQTSTPRAIFLSALTTVCSFGSLAISSHRGTASMGELLTLSLFYSLVTTLVVLPALLSLKGRLVNMFGGQSR